jgi:hypothetical protein
MSIKTEWHRAPDFAEIAEAIGVETTAIMGASDPRRTTVHVLYTPEPEQYPPTIYAITLKRDRDGILQRASVPVEQTGMWQKLTDDLNRKLG